MTNTIMLVHGAWLNSKSWENWKAYYEAKGFTVVAPDWPGDEGDPSELRAHPRKALSKIGPKQIVESYARAIAALPEAPILIGHSAGGVWVQYLLDRGLGAAGIAIDPAPAPGVPIGFQAALSALPVLGDPLSGGKVISMTRKFFKTRFGSGLPESVKDAYFERYIVPTAGKVYWDGIVGAAPLHWNNPDRAPLLLIAGGLDLIADASMTKANFERQKRASSVTEFKVYPDRSHTTCLEPGWEAVADAALEFGLRNARAANVSRIRTAA
jgi:pimeloyl-ACP methyl ester carboxylesterase